MRINRIYAQSCETMRELEADSVALTVTSPPYWNAIDYDIHAADKQQHYRTRKYAQGYADYEEYLDWLARIFQEVLRVTKPGGFCAIVIGTVLLNGRHYPVPFDLIARLSRSGWEFHQDIIWHKCTAGVKRAGVTIQKPYPGYYYPNIMTEYILIFRKPGTANLQANRSRGQRTDRPFRSTGCSRMDIANNVWHIAPVPPDVIDHPCPFPEEIPDRLIRLYSYVDDVVLDPFAGSGQTLKVAKQLWPQVCGLRNDREIRAGLARARVKGKSAIRPQQLIVAFRQDRKG